MSFMSAGQFVVAAIGLLLSGGVAVKQCAPVQADGFPPEVCRDQKSVEFRLENTGKGRLWVRLMVQHLQGGGTWEMRCEDAFGPTTGKQVRALAIEPGAPAEVIWQPSESCGDLPLQPGVYRLWATVTSGADAPKSSFAIAYFAVHNGECCPQPKGDGSKPLEGESKGDGNH